MPPVQINKEKEKMSEQIKYTVEWTINSGKLNEFKQIAQTAINSTKSNEPDMLGYQWYFNGDQSKCYLLERVSDSQALLAHFENVGQILPQLAEFAEITRFEIYGNLTEEAEKAIAPLGAKTFDYYDGFVR